MFITCLSHVSHMSITCLLHVLLHCVLEPLTPCGSFSYNKCSKLHSDSRFSTETDTTPTCLFSSFFPSHRISPFSRRVTASTAPGGPLIHWSSLTQSHMWHVAFMYGIWRIPHLLSGNIMPPSPPKTLVSNLCVGVCMWMSTYAVWESTHTHLPPPRHTYSLM